MLDRQYKKFISGSMTLKTKFLIVLIAYCVYWVSKKSEFRYNEEFYEQVEEFVQSFGSYQIPLNNQEYFGDDTNKRPISKYRKIRAVMTDCTNVFNTSVRSKISQSKNKT